MREIVAQLAAFKGTLWVEGYFADALSVDMQGIPTAPRFD
jgi:hypothetical protein